MLNNVEELCLATCIKSCVTCISAFYLQHYHTVNVCLVCGPLKPIDPFLQYCRLSSFSPICLCIWVFPSKCSTLLISLLNFLWLIYGPFIKIILNPNCTFQSILLHHITCYYLQVTKCELSPIFQYRAESVFPYLPSCPTAKFMVFQLPSETIFGSGWRREKGPEWQWYYPPVCWLCVHSSFGREYCLPPGSWHRIWLASWCQFDTPAPNHLRKIICIPTTDPCKAQLDISSQYDTGAWMTIFRAWGSNLLGIYLTTVHLNCTSSAY